MKYRFRLIPTLVFIFCLSANVIAQSPPTDRMTRDIEVAEDVLESLWSQTAQTDDGFNTLRSKQQFEGIYMQDYGVIFTAKDKGNSMVYLYGKARRLQGKSYWRNGQLHYEYDDRDRDFDDDEDEECCDNDFFSDHEVQFEDAAREFLANYGMLLGQLKDTEKVTIRLESSAEPLLAIANGQFTRKGAGGNTYTATAKKADMDAYQNGRIDEETFNERIEFTSVEEMQEVEQDLEVLATVLHKLYKRGFSNSFVMRHQPRYERLSDFGVIYHLDFGKEGNSFIWSNSGEGLTITNGSAKGDATEVTANYQILKKDLPEQMIDYGRLLKNLKPRERLMFRVSLPGCDDCDVPEALEYSIDQETLEAYKKGAISIDDAIGRITETVKGP
ncbi:MAG: hypothetical protein AAFO94_08875 [Bacteroidota bacterium]